MAVDQIARMMALDAAQQGGGTTDAYTKAETDALLDGKADLVDGKVPASQLPSYVDDVLEYSSTSSFPATGESGKIYVATDTNRTYRWGGSAYVEISESLALGETASTAYPGNKGKENADAIAKKPGEITTGKQYTIGGQTVTAGTGAEVFNGLMYNKASGQYSHAEGVGTTSSGFSSHAEGASTEASGNTSHVEGSSTKASGDSSHAEGGNTKASGINSHAEGNGTTASGINSHAEGVTTNASGVNSHAEGGVTTASGTNSHAEGDNTKASSTNQHVQGKYNVEDANDTYAFIIGNGTSNNARHNALAIDWNGLIYVNGAATGVDVSAFPSSADINTAITKANAAAPQSTTYTKTEIDTMLTMRKVYSTVHNASTTHTYTIKVSDFNNSQAGTYLITIVTWSATPSFSLYAVSYSGNVTTTTNLTKIAGADANISVTDGVISCTTTGKIQIIAVQ